MCVMWVVENIAMQLAFLIAISTQGVHLQSDYQEIKRTYKSATYYLFQRVSMGQWYPKYSRKRFENIKKCSLRKFLQVKKTKAMNPHFPLRSWVVGYMLKVQKQFLTLTFQNHTRSEQKDTLKAKFRFVVGCERWKKWLGGQDATHLLHNASIDSSMNEAF